MSKTEKILNHLKSGETITQIEAFNLYKSTRLSSIIFNLKKKGHDIVTIMHYDKLPDEIGGEPIRWAEYYLKKGEE